MYPMKTAFFACLLAASLACHSGFAAELPKVDTSTPKGTVKGLYDLAVAGDFDGLKKLFAAPANDQERELLADGLSDDFYIPALSAAILEKFPEAKVPNTGTMLERAKGGIDKLEEKIEGETATLTNPGQMAANMQNKNPFLRPILLQKQDGAWKIALTESRFLRLPPPRMKALQKARCEAMLEFIADTKAGKYASFEECDKSMKQKLADIHKQHSPGTQASPQLPVPTSPKEDDPTATTAKAPPNAPASDYEFVSIEVKTTRNEFEKSESVSVVIDFKNTIEKDVSALRGSLNIYDSTGTIVYMTGVTYDNGSNLIFKAGSPLQISLSYMEGKTIAAGKMAGKPLLDAIRGNPGEFKASLKVTQLKFTDKTEQNFP